MTPFGNAVSLVHGEQRDALSPDRLEKPLVVKSFGSDIEQFQLSRVQLPARLFGLIFRKRRIHAGCSDSVAAQVIDLVLHQSDKRGYDQRDPRPHQRG